MNTNVFQQIINIDDFQKYEWTKKYVRQMQVYLLGNNIEDGLFILTDCLGHWKFIPVKLDYELAEIILKTCEFVMGCVKDRVPPRHTDDVSLCRKCWACGRACFPNLDFGAGANIVENPEIEERLKRRDELSEQAKEYDVIDKEIKTYFRDKPLNICGDFIITGKEGIMKIPAKEAREVKTWKVKIERIK